MCVSFVGYFSRGAVDAGQEEEVLRAVRST